MSSPCAQFEWITERPHLLEVPETLAALSVLERMTYLEQVVREPPSTSCEHGMCLEHVCSDALVIDMMTMLFFPNTAARIV